MNCAKTKRTFVRQYDLWYNRIMTLNIAYRFRIYPTEEQKILLGKTFGCCRFLYNQMLNDKIREYEKTKRMLKNTPAMYKREYPFLKEVDSLALANVQLHLENILQVYMIVILKSSIILKRQSNKNLLKI